MERQIIIGIAILISLISTNTFCQVPPAGKYNTTNYPEDRKAIGILSRKSDSTRFINDDYIAVGPEGKISYGFEKWQRGFEDNGATFKSVTPVPGTTVLRIYNGDAAVKNAILDVVFSTPKGDFTIRVMRTETYINRMVDGIL